MAASAAEIPQEWVRPFGHHRDADGLLQGVLSVIGTLTWKTMKALTG